MPAMNQSTFLAGIGIAGFVGLVFGGIGGVLIGRMSRPAEAVVEKGAVGSQKDGDVVAGAKGNPSAAKGGLVSKKEFERLVERKNKQQIIAAVGRPDDTTDNVPRPVGKNVISGHTEWWYFRNRVLNEDTGKPYAAARVWMAYDDAFRIDYP